MLTPSLRAAGFAASLAAAAFAFSTPAMSADWPTQTVTIIDPFSPGGTTDYIARVLAEELGKNTGQSFVVENRGGAGGTIGTGRVAQAAPDGHTLLINNMSIAFSKALYPKLAYDPEKDIAPVAIIGTTPTVLAVANNVESKSIGELIDLAKRSPESLNFGSAGIGSTGHMAMVAFQQAAGIELQHIPYKGAGQVLTDLIGGRVSILMNTITPMVPVVKAGNVRGLGSSGKARSAALPDVPTIAESGLEGFEYAPWFSIFAPGGTPPETVEKIHAAIYRALDNPEVSAKLSRQGIELERASVQGFSDRYHNDIRQWSETIKGLGISLQ